MHRVSQWLALGSVLLPAAATAQTRQNWQAFDQYVAAGVRQWQVPGLAVAVVKDDSLVFARGYGVRELGKPDRVDEHTLFAIGSTTKAMTALSLLMLAEEGKVRLDNPALQYLPTLRLYSEAMTREITVRDLLTHHTGLPGSDLLWSNGDYDVQEIMRRMRYLKPVSSFRAAYNYQNVQYAMAGEVIRAASGQSWAEFLQGRIFSPLGMRETLPTLQGTKGWPNVATPHLVIDDTIRVIENRPVDPVAPAGAVWSSVSDMSKWMRFVLDSGRVGGRGLVKISSVADWLSPQAVVPPASFYPTARLSRPHQINYGLGWFLHDYRGLSVAMHTGSIDGMIAIIGLVPDQRLGVYVLANLDHAELRHALMYRVFDMYAGGALRDWSSELKQLYDGLTQQGKAAEVAARSARVLGTKPALPNGAYVGVYVDSLYGTFAVENNAGTLVARVGKSMRGTMSHWHYETFEVIWDDRRAGRSFITFSAGSDGKVSDVTADVGGTPVRYFRER